MPFDPITGHNFTPHQGSLGLYLECCYCLQKWAMWRILAGTVPHCTGATMSPPPPTLQAQAPSAPQCQTCAATCGATCSCACHWTVTGPATLPPPDPNYQGVAVDPDPFDAIDDLRSVNEYAPAPPPSKCECGAFKACGTGKGVPGHSSWCPWSPT